MLLRIGWGFLGVELVIAILFGLVFWYFWSRSAMGRASALKAISVYALGCALILLFSLLLPL